LSRIQKDGGEEIIEDEAVKKGWSGNPDRRENPNSFVSQEKPTLSYVPIRIVVAITLCVVGLSLRNTYLACAAVVPIAVLLIFKQVLNRPTMNQ
jgi:hypothetical protein